MLREFEYHDGAYDFFTSIGQDENEQGTYAQRAKHVNFEEKQVFKTYFLRIVGNWLF